MTIVVPLGLGLLLGWVFFGALWWTTRRMLGGAAVSLLLVCHVGRFALLAGGLVWAARLGAWPLLAMAGGITLARLATLRRIRSIPA